MLFVIGIFEIDLAFKNVSLGECLNSCRENGNDKDAKSALHARIQEIEAMQLVVAGQIAAAVRTSVVVMFNGLRHGPRQVKWY